MPAQWPATDSRERHKMETEKEWNFLHDLHDLYDSAARLWKNFSLF
jgi:hypothetical protein